MKTGLLIREKLPLFCRTVKPEGLLLTRQLTRMKENMFYISVSIIFEAYSEYWTQIFTFPLYLPLSELL